MSNLDQLSTKELILMEADISEELYARKELKYLPLFEDKEFMNWFNELTLLTYGEITDIDVLEDIYHILLWKEQRITISENIPDKRITVKEYWLYLSMLYDCIEYGSSPRTAWLTPLGETILTKLKGIYNETITH